MQKFKPLDLSFLGKAGSTDRQKMMDVAAAINANAGWGPSQSLLADFKALQDAEAAEMAKHKPTFLSGFFDLLSTPIYAVANALDESLAGHQSSNTDSILEDAKQMYGGAWTGTYRGLKAGLRGATSMADIIPGVDIDDEWQMNPEDKTRFGDVYTRLVTRMPTSEAMKEENWPEVKGRIESEKSEVPDFLKDVFYTDTEGPNAQQDFIRRMKMLGIVGDLALDPTMYITFGGKSAANVASATRGLEAARGSGMVGDLSKVPDTFKAAPNPIAAPYELPFSAAMSTNRVPGRVKTPAEITAPPAPKTPITASPEMAPAGGNEDLFDQLLREVLDEGHRVDDVVEAAGVITPPKIPAKSTNAISSGQQKALVKEITQLAMNGEKGWVYKAAEILNRHPNVDFENASRFLDMIVKSGKKPHPKAFPQTLANRILEDANKASRPGGELIDAVRKASVEKIIRPGEANLNATGASLANNLIAKYAPQILGKELPTGMHSPEALRASIARGDTAVYSGPKQANIWNGLTMRLGWAGPDKFKQAVNIMRAINNHFESLGAIAHSAASISGKKGIAAVPLRLDQVAEAIGPDVMGMSRELITRILAGEPKAMATLTAQQQAAIKALRESSSVVAANAAKPAIQEADQAAAAIQASNQSVARKAEQLQQLPKMAGQNAAANGAGDAGSDLARQYIASRLAETNPIDQVFKTSGLDTIRALSPGQIDKVVDTYYAGRVTNAIRKAADLPAPAQLGKISGSTAAVKDWLGARFNAAYGVKDMRPIFLQEQAAGLTTVAARTKYINELARNFDPKDLDLWHEAMRAAQMDSITTGRISELQGELSKTLENLFGGTGLRASAIAEATVVGRSRVTMKELNENMKRFGLGQYQFTAGNKVKDAVGGTHDLSKGADWLNSWQFWNVKNPYEFLHRVQQAVESTVREKNMFDEIAARFGSPKRHGNVKYGINHPRLKGYYFNEEAARQGEVFVRMLDEVTTPNPKSLQYIDHVISKLKAALTIYIPSHHWTNMIGDTYFNWLAGVNDPRRYNQAMKVMQSQRGRYGDIAQFQKGVVGPEAELQSIARGVLGHEGMEAAGLASNAAGNSVATTMRNGTRVTNDMIYVAAMQRGILPSARVLEEVTSDVSSILDKFRPLGGHGQAAVHKISEVRDHIPRLAQFIDGISKSRKGFHQAADDSAAAVRKWHPDGLDLTKFERDVMKRIFPFYSWTRKAIPLAIQSALTRPGKVMAYPHLMEAIALSNEITPGQGTIGTFPTDQMFPDWIRERGIGPVAGGPGSYLFVNPSTPVLDVGTLLGHPGQSALDMLNPLAKVPIEMAGGSTLGKNVPIENNADYLSKQIPGVSHIGRTTGYYGTSDSVADSPEQLRLNLYNLLFGTKATQSGIYQKSAQFDLRDYLKEKRQGGN